MYKPWLTESLILMAIILLFGIVGTMEKLPKDAERKLELARQGIELETTVAVRY